MTRSRALGTALRFAARAPAELWALGAGALFSYAQAPSPPLLALFALFAMLSVVFALFDGVERPWRAARIGWCFGFGYFFACLWWIGAAFDVFAEQHGWMKPFAQTLLPAFLALFWAAAFGGAAWATRRLGLSGWRRCVWLALLWSLVEYARGGVLTGFPWGMAGYAWLDTPAAQLAAWVGPYGLTAATLCVATPLGCAAVAASRAHWRGATRFAGVWAGSVLALNLAGWARLDDARPVADGAVIRLVQPNVPQREKAMSELDLPHANLMANLTGAPSEGRIALVAWPESSSPYLLEWAGFWRASLAMVAPDGARLVIGAARYDVADRLWRNSLYVVGPDGAIEDVYDKRHLVPFGETIPFRETLGALGVTEIASAFEPGRSDPLIRLENGRSFVALICYEAVFPTLLTSERSERPDFILQLTNDAWFGDSGGPWQHLAQARFRAIEQGAPLYRAANTGISAAIDPYGRLVSFVPLNSRAVLDAPLQEQLVYTIYTRIGQSAWLALVLVAAVFTFIARKNRNKISAG